MIGIASSNLDAQLAREKMMIDDARARQVAAMEERNRERQHQQQMAQFGLNEMKFNYEKQQDEVGGLKYQETMARIGQYNAGASENQAQADYYKRRAENPEAFRSPGAAARPRVIPLTAGQIKANADAAALGQKHLPYKVTVVNPGTGGYGSAYINANVNDPNDPALRDLQTSIAEQSPDGNPYTVGPVANDPAAWELPHDSQGTNDNSLLDPSLIPPANPGPPNFGPQTPAPTFQPGDVVPIDPATPAGQGALPMDPASVQRRQAMEYERITKQAAVSAALSRQKADAAAALAIDPKDQVALAQKAAADEELKKLFTPPPKATVVSGSPVASNPPGYGVLKPNTPAVPAAPPEFNPAEVPSLRERNAQNANAGINAQWDSFKGNVLSELPKAFNRPELAMVMKSIKQGEEDELAAELAARGSSLVEVKKTDGDTPIGSGGFMMGAAAAKPAEKAVFKKLKAPNGEMVSGFEVLKMTLPLDDNAGAKGPSDAATSYIDQREKAPKKP
ncbi:MAG: hypothetical protein EBS21_02475 [Sphingomonadaceae bacterium]|nr:hypothetical protein [Sphingomonadaceae bacterium]